MGTFIVSDLAPLIKPLRSSRALEGSQEFCSLAYLLERSICIRCTFHTLQKLVLHLWRLHQLVHHSSSYCLVKWKQSESKEWSSQLIFQFKQLERRSLKKSGLQHHFTPHGKIRTQLIDLAPNVWLLSSVGRASHWYRGGHRFESRWSPDFFRLLLSNCLNWKINCDDHSSL